MHALRPARRLSPGDLVAVIAPSGPVPQDRFARGVERLAGRYELRWDEALFSREGFLAGDDDRRADELARALRDPAVRGVWCARGGYGLTRLLARIDPEPLRRDPRPIVGFSDVTALHGLLFAAGLRALHGAVLTQPTDLDEGAAELPPLLESSAPPAPWSGLEPIAPGVAEGLAVGGNLEVYTRLVGTPFLPRAPAGARLVLFLEEVGERPYRIDRALTHLAAAGALDDVAAIVVGDLTRCAEPDGTSDAAAVVRERLAALGVPVVCGAPFGHDRRNRPFVIGGRVRVDGSAGHVEFLDGLVD